jgi:ferric-dicitrate binding protein FerR (iron transport regulator)
MKRDERNVEEVLRGALPSAPRDEMEAAVNRVFARLQSDTSPRPSNVRAESAHAVTWWRPALRFAAAALVVAAGVWGAVSLRDQEIYAVLEASDGSLYRVTDGTRVPVHVGDRIRAQETVQSNGAAGAVLALADGSHVEMRSKSALAWDRATDGLTIRLDSGSIIVNAAEQPAGHLYVQTKDVTVSVAGTIILVNAEEDGSRVAVIQGEVSVREQNAKIDTKLRPVSRSRRVPHS